MKQELKDKIEANAEEYSKANYAKAPKQDEGDAKYIMYVSMASFKAGMEKVINNPAEYLEQQPVKDEKCIAGCHHFTGGEIKHHYDCPNYPNSLSQLYDQQNDEILRLRKQQPVSAVWVKARERLPYETKACNLKYNGQPDLALFDKETSEFYSDVTKHYKLEKSMIEWLDESPKPLTDKDIEKLAIDYASQYWRGYRYRSVAIISFIKGYKAALTFDAKALWDENNKLRKELAIAKQNLATCSTGCL